MATTSAATEASIIEDIGRHLMPDAPESSTPEEEPAAAIVQYDFEGDFQERIVALMMRDPKFMRRTEGLILPQYMDSEAMSFLVDVTNSYFEKYRRIPRGKAIVSELFKDAFSTKRIRDELKREIITTYKSINKVTLEDGDFIADKVGEFSRRQAVIQAYFRSQSLIDKGDLDGAQKLMKKAFDTGTLDNFEEIDYWNDIEARTQYRKDKVAGLIKPSGITTGIPRLDKMLYHKGWGRKELSCLMGGAKKGKSMGLGFFAVNASKAGYNVLYITMEVAGDIIADRNDANVSGTDMDDLDAKMHSVSSAVQDERARAGRGELRIVSYPAGTLTPSGLRRIIERYRADGIVFDMIVPDYADIMAPDHYVDNAQENSKQVWLGLRAIAHEEDCAMLTATQTNRDGFKKDTARAEDAAEDFNKVRIADLIMSINRSDDEKASGEARLFLAASRNQAGELTIKITQDLSKMQFIKGVTGFS
jgi:replicative DNA helicase